MKKRIILTGPYPPPYGGISTFMEGLYKLFLDSKEDFIFIASSTESIKKRNIVKLASKPWYLVQWFVHLRSARVCLDCYEFLFEHPNWRLAIFWYLLRKIHRFKWVKIIHNGSLPERYHSFNRTRKLVFRQMLNCVDELVVVNNVLAEWITNELGYAKNINVIGPLLPNLIDSDEQVMLDENICQFIRTHDKTILSIGLFNKPYGFHEVVNAIENIRNRYNLNLGCILIDGAFNNDPEYKKLVLGDRDWILHLEKIENPKVREIIKHCDIFVRPFQYESYGLSRIEAIMSKKPVIATNVGETRGMLVYEYGDLEGLIALLESCLFSTPSLDSEFWSDFYRHIAAENWSEFQRIVR